MKEFKSELKNILSNESSYTYLEVSKIDKGFELSYGCMYSSPELSFAQLKKLSEFFGTDNIDVDNYSQGGCDTCDYGSKYGHTIQIRDMKEHENELASLVGKGDIYE